MRATADKIAFAQSYRGQFAHPLRGVTKERYFMSQAKIVHLAPRLQHAGLVVGRHHRDQAGPFFGQPHAQGINIQLTASVHRQKTNAPAEVTLRSLDHARVFDGREPHLGIGRKFLRVMMQDKIVGFGGPGGPHDIQRSAL